MEQCTALIVRGVRTGTRVGAFLTRNAAPLVDLAMRLMMARIFFRSGLQKLSNWESTVYLFRHEYQVPILPPELAAMVGAATELTAPILLVLGLMTRLAAIPMLCMTLVIQFVLGTHNPAYDLNEHFFWMVLLLSLILRGPGLLSLDHLIATRLRRSGKRFRPD